MQDVKRLSRVLSFIFTFLVLRMVVLRMVAPRIVVLRPPRLRATRMMEDHPEVRVRAVLLDTVRRRRRRHHPAIRAADTSSETKYAIRLVQASSP